VDNLRRGSTAEVKETKVVPWEGTTPPSSTYEVLDWLSVQDLLSTKGYTDQQIHAIYQMRIQELKDTTPFDERRYSTDRPYYKMLSG
jgi:hypothetical protein